MLKNYFNELNMQFDNDEERIEYLIKEHKQYIQTKRKYYELLSQMNSCLSGRLLLKKFDVGFKPINKNEIGYSTTKKES